MKKNKEIINPKDLEYPKTQKLKIKNTIQPQ